MQDAHAFLTSLTVVLAVAAVTTVVFQRLRQPVVLGYIIAGLIVGPHVPIPLVADPNVVQTLSELGVILLMFSLGLKFSLRKLMAVGPTAGLTALPAVQPHGVAGVHDRPPVRMDDPRKPSGALVLALVMLMLGVAFWRSATNLQGHVRAGAEVVLEALAAQSRPRSTTTGTDTLEQVHQLLPGLGALAAVRLDPGSVVIGRTLAQVNLRGRTGATVLAITRADGGVLVPTAGERLRVGDVLAVAGTHEAIEAAKAALGA